MNLLKGKKRRTSWLTHNRRFGPLHRVQLEIYGANRSYERCSISFDSFRASTAGLIAAFETNRRANQKNEFVSFHRYFKH